MTLKAGPSYSFLRQEKTGFVINVFLLFLLMVLFFFKFQIDYNEMDVVPFAKATFDEKWLVNDWYLNLKIPYRFFFSSIIGFFAAHFGFVKTIIFGRLISYLIMAYSLSMLIKASKFKLKRSYSFFALILFFQLFPKGIGAGEWMLGGLETKVFAYAFAILSLSFFLTNKYKKGLFCAGLSLSFHLLVGVYHIFCLIPLFVFFQKEQKDYWLKIVKASPLFFISGSLGVFGILNHFFHTGKEALDVGWHIYVNIRVPHHTLPSSFLIEFWVKLFVFTMMNVFFMLKSKRQGVQLLSYYAVFTAIISVIGLLVYFLLDTHHMKYYFFRTSCILLPLITFLNGIVFLVEKLQHKSVKGFRLNHLLVLAICVLVFSKGKHFVKNFSVGFKESAMDDVEMVTWVKKNTNKSKVFITSPSNHFFYLNYERPMFVSWKHSPQSSRDIIEWYDRLKFLNKGKDFTNKRELNKVYECLTTKDVLKICKVYKNVGYILTSKQVKLDFPVLYESDKSILYQL